MKLSLLKKKTGAGTNHPRLGRGQGRGKKKEFEKRASKKKGRKLRKLPNDNMWCHGKKKKKKRKSHKRFEGVVGEVMGVRLKSSCGQKRPVQRWGKKKETFRGGVGKSLIVERRGSVLTKLLLGVGGGRGHQIGGVCPFWPKWFAKNGDTYWAELQVAPQSDS